MAKDPGEPWRWRERDLDDALMQELSSREPSEVRVKELVRQGANINSVQDGHSVLMEAIQFTQDVPRLGPDERPLDVRFVHLLVELGADVNYSTDDGSCALWLACWSENPPIVEYLLAQGADPNVVLDHGPEAILDAVEFHKWYDEQEAGGDSTSPRASCARILEEVISLLRRFGAKPFGELRASRIRNWLLVFGSYDTGLLTANGGLDIDGVPGIADAVRADFKAWRGAFWDSWPKDDWSSRPAQFDRRRHNDWGRQLCRFIRSAVPPHVAVEYLTINADAEAKRIRNVDRETIE
jgi:hypothetical protein